MAVDIRTAEGEADLVGWGELLVEAFATPGLDRALEYARLYPEGDVLVAVEGGRVVAGLGLCRAAQRWGGADVPGAHVAAVCTAAERRGQGLASRMMREALALMRARGQAVSALYPASLPLYRKVGYEVVGVASRMRLRLAELGPTTRMSYEVRGEDDVAADLAAADRRAAAGNLTARGTFFARRLARPRDPPKAYGLYRDGLRRASLVLGRTPAERGRHDLDVRALYAEDDDAMAALVAFLQAQGSIGRHATWLGAPTDRVVMGLATEAWEVERASPWMLRVVDVAAAIRTRRFAPGLGGAVTIGVVDPICPWNHGAWRVTFAGGRAEIERVGDAPPAAGALDARGVARLFAGLLADAPDVPAGASFAGPTPWLQEGF